MRTYENDFGITALSLQVGENDTERRLVWFHRKGKGEPRVRMAALSDYERDGGFTEQNARVIFAKTETPVVNRDFLSSKVRITGLSLGESYVYNVGDDTGYDIDVHRFSIPKSPKQKLNFGIVSDVHFNVYQRKENDTRYLEAFRSFSDTVKRLENYEDERLGFIMSIGDNCSVYQMSSRWFADPGLCYPEGIALLAERENEEFLTSDVMKETALCTVLGNHDAQGLSEPGPYASVTAFHYDPPNDDGKSGHFFDNSIGNSYFVSGEVLFIGLNAFVIPYGNYCGSVEVHREFIKRAIDAHPEARWRVLFNHVPAYAYVGSANLNDKGNPTEPSRMREIFAEILHGIDLDVIFAGHQHAFSRSFHIKDGAVVDRKKIKSERDENGYLTESIKNPDGTMHYNVPAPTAFSFFSDVSKDCHDVYANYGICDYQFDELKVSGYAPTNDFRGFTYKEPLSIHVSVENDGAERRMTIKCLGTNDGIARDTYTIIKTI